MPFNSELNIKEERKLFEFRNKKTKIPSNFGKKDKKCKCGVTETMDHIWHRFILPLPTPLPNG